MMRALLCVMFLVASSFLYGSAFAQGCCGIGSSLVSGGTPTLDQGTFFGQMGGDYSRADFVKLNKKAINATVAYGITKQLSVSLRTSYAWLNSSLYQPALVGAGFAFPETTLVYNNNDWADGMLGAQFSIIPMTVLTKQELKAGVDVGIPWGPDQKTNGILPKNMQTGSGAYTIGGFASYNRAFPVYKLAAAASIAGRLKFRNRRNDDPGNEASMLVAALAGPFWKIRASTSLNYRATAPTYESGVKVPSTQGTRLDFLPGMECTLTENIKMTCEAEVPLWRDPIVKVYGNNLGLRVSMLFFIPLFES